jgi:hypothetical protein
LNLKQSRAYWFLLSLLTGPYLNQIKLDWNHIFDSHHIFLIKYAYYCNSQIIFIKPGRVHNICMSLWLNKRNVFKFILQTSINRINKAFSFINKER